MIDDWLGQAAAMGLLDHVDRYRRLLDGSGLESGEQERTVAAWGWKYVKSSRSSSLKAKSPPDDLFGTEPQPSPGISTSDGDRVAEKDLLGRGHLVRALAAMFAAPGQGTPFTVALFGDWGSGKSSVMNLVQKELRDHYPGRCEFAWFNAWEYEQTDSLRAGLAQEVVRGLTDGMTWFGRLGLRLRLAWGELCSVGTLAVISLVIVLFMIFSQQNAVVTSGLASLTLLPLVAYQLWKQLPQVMEHPATSRIASVIVGTDYSRHLGQIPVMQKQVQAVCAERLGVREQTNWSVPTEWRLPDSWVESRAVSAARRWLHSSWESLVGSDDPPKDSNGQILPKRLVLFIDDLDRCGPRSISGTLDAVRLVMNVEHVIVVLAVDQRIAFRAMELRYRALKDQERSAREIARDYLEKIVQLPIQLDPAGDSHRQRYIHERLFDETLRDAGPGQGGPASQGSPETLAAMEGGEDDPSLGLSGEQREPASVSADAGGEPPEGSGSSDPAIEPGEETAELGAAEEQRQQQALQEEMVLTSGERDLFIRLSKLFDFHNPRLLLHLRNWYRLLKTMELLRADRLTEPEVPPESLMRMLFWQQFLAVSKEGERPTLVWALFMVSLQESPSGGVMDEYVEELAGPFGLERPGSEGSPGSYRQLAARIRLVHMPSGGERLPETMDEAKAWREDQDRKQAETNQGGG